jgi:D-beta-D-heptose 7-phosphate kinase / D-beta-D-heptose 1-phosphate adenosyltransferase
VIETIRKLQARYQKVLVGDAKDLLLYREVGLTAVKPNFGEALALLKLKDLAGQDRPEFLTQQRERFLELTGARIAAVTMDTDGALIFERGHPPYRTYARPNPNSRAAGAGDTFVSALALGLAAGIATSAAAELASAAAAVVVNKEGTSSCTAEELQEHFLGTSKYFTDPARLKVRLESHRQPAKRLVFTNGCFDILHPGHINFLNQAKELGDILVVAVNSDASVAKLKGPGRPINRLEDRLQMLAALSCIDYLISFEELSPDELIKVLKPEIVVKGGNYTREMLPEAALIEAQGSKLHFLPYLPDRSTSHLLERIREILEEAEAAAEPAESPRPPQPAPTRQDLPVQPYYSHYQETA